MDGSVPRDIASDKQSVLSKQLDQLEGHLAVFDQSAVDMNAGIVAATSLLSRCGAAYEAASGPIRRDYNQAWFDESTSTSMNSRLCTPRQMQRTSSRVENIVGG
ncbi:hypothetical protein CH272_04450 [Rhodococcus sp. 05-340-1]|nr:hypothetical protein CH271_26345 [Rhodococcus sp. 05-340-2]OZD82474.1 hypothetical protein CH272_04450 [Rhodococcus sp. 05-340-1]